MHYNICITLKIKQEDGTALIGRHARAELWTRFVNGAVKPMDAEIICNLTRGVRQQERVEEIQGKCCVLLDTGKSWEYIGGMVQLMANKQQVAMSQGLLDFGADFQADLERAAEWVARSIRAIDETIRVLKDGLKQSGRKRDVAQRIGVNTEVEVDAAETLRDLQVLRKQYEMIGNYPELVQKAEYWDGESEVDPVGDYLEHARRERLEAEAEGEMSADEYLEAQARREAQEAVPGLFGDGMSMEMRAVESPEKLGEAQAQRKRDLTLENEHVDKDEAWEHLEALAGRPLRNKRSGFVAVVNKPQRKELTDIGKALVSSANGFSVDAHYAAVSRIEKLFENAVYCGEYPDLKHGEATVHIHRFACPMMIGGEKAVAWLTAKQTTNVEGSERLYNLELVDIEKLAGTLEYLASHRLDTALPSASTDILAQIDDAFKTYFEDAEGNTFSASVETVREMGLLSDGHLVADNAVVVEPGVSFSIEALHASPHKFREFSTDKMGTGEGHQAFGWGLYFSGGRESNEHYYRQFASYRMRYGVDGAVEENESAGYVAVYKVIGDVIMKHGGDEMYLRETNRITAMLHDGWRIEDLQKKDAKWWMEKQPRAYKAAYKAALKELAERGVMVERVDKPSINYRVDLNVDESELLDWDGAVSDELYAEAQRVSPDSFGTVPRKKVKGRTVYAALQYELGTAKAASEWLAARGYKGIKYLDGGSRDVGVGTHNYVIFSGRDVKITGINASGDYGAAWEEMEPVESPVTFSVIGEKAKTWGKYKDRAFEGRDDGKMRAEIDASKARVKSGIFGVDKVEVYRQLIAEWGRLPEEERFAVLDYADLNKQYKSLRSQWRRGGDEAVEGAMREKEAEVKAAEGAAFEVLEGWFAQRGVEGLRGMLDDAHMEVLAGSFLDGGVDNIVADVLGGQRGEQRYNLGDVLDYEELYEAYPELRVRDVTFRKLEEGVRGRVEGWGGIALAPELRFHEEALRSVLLHEVQHAVQRIEGFARGGNTEGVYDRVQAEIGDMNWELRLLEREMRFFEAPGQGRDYLRAALGFLRTPKRAVKRSGLAMALRRPGESVEETAERCVAELRRVYDELVEKDTEWLGLYVREQDEWRYAMPRDVDFGDEGAVARALRKVEGLPGRRSVARGVAPVKAREMKALVAKKWRFERLARDYRYEPFELYRRLAGEIEARGVQARLNMTVEERAGNPFNEALEYPGEALVTFSMERASLNALEVLRTRADEREGERLVKDWQKQCELLGMMHDDKESGSRLGRGAKMLGEMHALIGATKGVLPEKYTHMGRLNGLLKWAAVYARMQQEGEVPVGGVIAGEIYERFVRKMQEVDAMNRLHGLTEEEAKEALALLAGERLDVAMLKVATECKRRLELFLKDRERERIDWVVERAYPKREKGKRTPRGKMDADAYRRMERAYALMEMEANEVAGLMERLKAALDKLDSAPAEAVEVLEGMRHREVPAADDVDGLEEALEDELYLAQTFGAWENMGYEQARHASGAMAEMVLMGKNAWQDRLREERRRAAYDREEIARHFRTMLEGVQMKRGQKDAAEKGRKRTIAKKIAMGSMSYGQLMLALEDKLGKRFTGRHMRMIAAAHEELMVGNLKRQKWMYDTLARITGLKKEGEIEEWMVGNNTVIDTGIDLEMPMKTKCRLTPEEAREWLRMTAEEREKKREQMMVEAAAKGEKPDNVPGEDVLDELEARMMEAEQNGVMPKVFELVTEWSYRSRLHCTKEALLYAVLTFEQEDYEHLLAANGLTEAKLQQMRKLVGRELLSWGYAMRRELNEHAKVLAKVYEAYTGVPFASRQNYFRGVFDVARAKDAGEAVDQVGGVTGGKYGILTPRQYHNQQLNWGTSATMVFVATMKEQANYIATAHIGREWRTLLSDRLFERRLRAEIGDAALDMINGWCSMIDGAVLADAKVNALMHRFLGRLLGAYAVSRLAGNAYTIMKQVSALLNGFVGGYVPERVIAGDALVRDLTYRHIGFGEYIKALAKAVRGKTEIRREEVEQAGFIEGRRRGEGSHIEAAAMLAPGQSVPGRVGRVGRAVWEGNMDLIGYVDRKCNLRSALALAEAVYQQGKAENKDGLVPDKELRRVALETARMMVDRAAQPQLRTQKGYWAAGGGAFGALGNFFYMFKSEVLGKLGLYVAQMMAGRHGAWIMGALSFGVLNSLVLALIDWIGGRWYDDDEDKWAKRGKKFAANVVLNDISSVPVIGAAMDDARSALLGEWRPEGSQLVDMVMPFGDIWNYGKREWKNAENGAGWDKHVAALCGLARGVGALGGWGQNVGSAAVGSAAELALAGAAISNTVRAAKDMLKKVLEELE